MTRTRAPIFDRLVRLSDRSGDCWLWTGARYRNGYGQMCLDGKRRSAHRVSWEAANGPVPVGLDLDHVCRVRHCINPAHLEPVTRSENMRRALPFRTYVSPGAPRRETCMRGLHSMEEASVGPHGRYCRNCRNERQQERRRRNRASAVVA
jgi:hypothetical protein